MHWLHCTLLRGCTTTEHVVMLSCGLWQTVHTTPHIPVCRISLPAVWTNASNVSFNYTGFHAASTLHFTWCLGTSPGASDIIPCTALTGKVIPNTNIIADEAVPHGISVLQQDYTLDSKLLLEGQLYFLMIQVLDKQAKSIAQMVAPPIKVCC